MELLLILTELTLPPGELESFSIHFLGAHLKYAFRILISMECNSWLDTDKSIYKSTTMSKYTPKRFE